MVILDKRITKILRYIKRKDTPAAGDIIKKFMHDNEGDIELIQLCKDGYLLCIKDDGTFTDFSEPFPWHSSSSYRYWATPKTNKYLQDKFSDYARWMLPTVLSLISLLISVITFLYAVVDKSPILVRLLE